MDLASLHAAVPAAEEEDLLEEVHVEAGVRDRTELVDRLLGGTLQPLVPAANPPDANPPDAVPPDLSLLADAPPGPAPVVDGPDPLSDGQVLGLVEHLLGAEVVSVEVDPVQRLS